MLRFVSWSAKMDSLKLKIAKTHWSKDTSTKLKQSGNALVTTYTWIHTSVGEFVN